MGVDLADFWHLTPHSLYLIADGYNRALKRQLDYDNHMAYIQGAYFLEALMASVGNMFAKKGQKGHEYPDKPYSLANDLKEKEKNETEEERQRKLFAAQLSTAMANFNLSKQKDGQS